MKTLKMKLTDRLLKYTLKPLDQLSGDILKDLELKDGETRNKPYDVADLDRSAPPSFGCRVMTTGRIAFQLFRRFPGSPHPVRRVLGHFGEMSLADARELGRKWIAQIREGIDPTKAEKALEQAQIEAESARRTNTFSAVLESYLLAKAKLRSVHAVEIEIKRECAAWLDRPIENIGKADVEDLIRTIQKNGRKGQAVYALIAGFFNWAVKNDRIQVSPCARIDRGTLVGDIEERKRVLDNDELRAYWRAADRLGSPNGDFWKFLALTALRRTEASDISRTEIDMEALRLVVPGERMKKGLPHLVPITPRIAALLDRLPRHNAGDFIFSTSAGVRPISAFSRMKKELDAAMAEELAKIGKPFVPFVIHDVRRTCRSKFSDTKLCRIDKEIKERLLAHIPAKLERTYDQHDFEMEKADALESWHVALFEKILRPDLRIAA